MIKRKLFTTMAAVAVMTSFCAGCGTKDNNTVASESATTQQAVEETSAERTTEETQPEKKFERISIGHDGMEASDETAAFVAEKFKDGVDFVQGEDFNGDEFFGIAENGLSEKIYSICTKFAQALLDTEPTDKYELGAKYDINVRHAIGKMKYTTTVRSVVEGKVFKRYYLEYSVE